MTNYLIIHRKTKQLNIILICMTLHIFKAPAEQYNFEMPPFFREKM